MDLEPPGRVAYAELIQRALAEDVGAGDVTTAATVPSDARARGTLLAKAALVVAGLDIALEAFRQLDPHAVVEVRWADGAHVQAHEAIAFVTGRARALLTAERTALNVLQRLSGIATLTDQFVVASRDRITVLDTRKTTPGWRMLEKAAVRAGGGKNHRFALGDGILVKDNHVAACGGVAEAVRRARAHAGAMLKVEVEVVDLPGLEAAIAAGADIVLLDNMDDAAMAEAVRRAAGRVLLEASGNMTLERLPRVAATGVDFVSMGAITHSARAVDISFELG
jgi:nicotinate-nucleotide pyrophosphorylase (carboxylating)